jgi:hypothetical protein
MHTTGRAIYDGFFAVQDHPTFRNAPCIVREVNGSWATIVFDDYPLPFDVPIEKLKFVFEEGECIDRNC